MNVKDGLLGFAVGDALGVPVEFMPRDILIKDPVVDMRKFGTHDQPEGTWSDDTSMMIATMDAISTSREMDYEQIADNFCTWLSGKKYSPHDEVFDVGITTSTALRNYANGASATKAGCDSFYDNGNGSLMRILPLAYYFEENPMSNVETSEIINNISSITHGHEISCLGCYLYVKYAMSLLEGKDFKESYEKLQKVDTSMYSSEANEVYHRILSGELDKIKDSEKIKSSGFVVDSLEATIWSCLTTNSYEEAVLKAVNLGNDTDTIGGLTGGLAGIRYGIEKIPSKWLDVLVKKDYLENIADKYQNTIKNMQNKNESIGNRTL